MNSKILIAATAAASLALATTTAFAGEGNGDPFPFSVQSAPVTITAGIADTGAAGYQRIDPALSTPSQLAETLPPLGSQGAVQTANSLPAGFEVGTAAYAQAKATNRWFASQGYHYYAGSTLPNG